MIPAGWQVIEVSDLTDPRLDSYRSLTDMDLRLSQESVGGFFMAEGLLIIERAATAECEIVSILTARRWLPRLSSVLARWTGPVFVVDDAAELTGYRVHRGALAHVRRPVSRSCHELLRRPGSLLVLENLVDHTNVGLAFRSAAALGIRGVIVSPACADPLYRRAVKASMGAVLSVPWARADFWPIDLRSRSVDAPPRSVIALTPDPGGVPLETALRERAHADVALVVGSEGPGLTSQALAAADVRARIPMDSGVDSLNVAAATAVACYALRMTSSNFSDKA